VERVHALRSLGMKLAAAAISLALSTTAFAQTGFSPEVPEVRVKDIARLEPVRDNQLTGLGLVVGLDGTGDSRTSVASMQMVANMLERFGLTVTDDQLRLRNVAAVMVTATLPAFARPGDRIDATVSSIGDARSLQGGYLLMTPLVAANGEVYAVAEGPVSIGGFNVRSGSASVQRNHPVVGMVTGGAIVERTVPITLGEDGLLTWVLQDSDFSTANRVAEAINERFGDGTAIALDGSAVQVRIPEVLRSNPVPFIAMVDELTVRPDAVAQVVVNERTGTIVVGHNVRIATVAVAHGGISVRIEQREVVSQPPSFSGGQTVVTRETTIEVEEGRGNLMVLESGGSVQQLVQALNSVGASPRDVIAILQAIEAAGALYGKLVVI